MKIEVLYFQGCPNLKPAVERVQAVLAGEGISADILYVEFSDTTKADFPGSPTIRIDGMDVEPGAVGAAGFSCRTYIYGSAREGVPSVEVIRRAVRNAGASRINDEVF